MNKINDRGMIKWQPFDSVTSTKKMTKEIAKSKNKIEMPILSEDQLIQIENNLKEAYYNSNDVTITYYFNGVLIKKNVKIKRLDYVKKQIRLSDNTLLYYKQIVKIKV